MPYFRHDCNDPHCCTYVGSTERDEANVWCFDVYVTNTNSNRPTDVRARNLSLIIRGGDDGPEYRMTPFDSAAHPRLNNRVTNDNHMWKRALQIYDNYLARLEC